MKLFRIVCDFSGNKLFRKRYDEYQMFQINPRRFSAQKLEGLFVVDWGDLNPSESGDITRDSPFLL
jgi:hypothetical protein